MTFEQRVAERIEQVLREHPLSLPRMIGGRVGVTCGCGARFNADSQQTPEQHVASIAAAEVAEETIKAVEAEQRAIVPYGEAWLKRLIAAFRGGK